jgi:hypothetical protein
VSNITRDYAAIISRVQSGSSLPDIDVKDTKPSIQLGLPTLAGNRRINHIGVEMLQKKLE